MDAHRGVVIPMTDSDYDLSSFAASSRDTAVDCQSPDPTQYHDVRDQRTAANKPLATTMPNGHGIMGTVIPCASMFGGGLGFDLKQGSTKVAIDPLYNGNNFTIDLTKITNDIARSASAIVNKHMPTATDIDGARCRHAAVFHVMKQHIDRDNETKGASHVRLNNADAATMPSQAVPQEATQRQQTPATPQTSQAAPDVRPASFSQTQRQPQPREAQSNLLGSFQPPSPVPQGATTPATSVASPFGPMPTVKVKFGMVVGDTEAMLHSVMRQEAADGGGGILILGLDTAYTGPRFMPRLRGDERMAVQVDGSPSIFLVESMGVQFEHRGELLTQFLIVNERIDGAGGG